MLFGNTLANIQLSIGLKIRNIPKFLFQYFKLRTFFLATENTAKISIDLFDVTRILSLLSRIEKQKLCC